MHQITRSPSYLIRNPHSYCFRMTVPAELRPLIGKRELRYSLQTGYLKQIFPLTQPFQMQHNSLELDFFSTSWQFFLSVYLDLRFGQGLRHLNL